MAKLIENFDWICVDINILFDQIQEYFEIIEKQADIVKDENVKKIKSRLGIINDEEEYREESSILYYEHYQIYEEIIPRCLSYSFVTMTYTAIETSFNDFIKDLKKRNNINDTEDVFKRSLSEKIKHYIKKFNLEGSNDKDIETIKNFALIRNNIIHRNGFVSKDVDEDDKDDKIKKVIKEEKHLSLMNNQIVIKTQFCYEKIEYFKEMFNRLFKKLGYKQGGFEIIQT